MMQQLAGVKSEICFKHNVSLQPPFLSSSAATLAPLQNPRAITLALFKLQPDNENFICVSGVVYLT